MTMTFDVRNKNVTVVGAGRSGGPAAELLAARGAHVTLADSAASLPNQSALQAVGITTELGPHRVDQFAAADLLVLSPGVDPDQAAIAAARRAGVPVIGEVEMASRWLKGRWLTGAIVLVCTGRTSWRRPGCTMRRGATHRACRSAGMAAQDA